MSAQKLYLDLLIGRGSLDVLADAYGAFPAWAG